MDIECIENANKSKKIMIHTVDPGRSDVVSVCDIKLRHCVNSNKILNKGTFWSVSNDEYCDETIRSKQTDFELKRRSANKKYNLTLTNLNSTIKKSVIMETFIEYVQTITEHFKSLIKESN